MGTMKLDFNKGNGLIPVIIQDAATLKVLMLGYMNEEALNKTRNEGKVTFYSRTKQRLWTKGETSGNFLEVDQILPDCDADTLLIKVKPKGSVCHKGTDNCFADESPKGFLGALEVTIDQRADVDPEKSYTARLLAGGINKVAQKVGEEATEVIIEAKDNDKNLFLSESADLLYHFMVLLKAKGVKLSEIEQVLKSRHNQ